MTDKERLKTDTVFVDTVIRECALMMIQKEADALKIEELEERLSTIPPATPSVQDVYEIRVLQQRLNEAIADLRFVMAGGEPCKVCTVKCAFGDECKPVWRGEEATR